MFFIILNKRIEISFICLNKTVEINGCPAKRLKRICLHLTCYFSALAFQLLSSVRGKSDTSTSTGIWRDPPQKNKIWSFNNLQQLSCYQTSLLSALKKGLCASRNSTLVTLASVPTGRHRVSVNLKLVLADVGPGGHYGDMGLSFSLWLTPNPLSR